MVVCAPTGSGKTLTAEAAAAIALESGQRLFYTTPLKALSNQKFRDLGALFGTDRCGLLTGDITIRPGAPLVVMTTEVFRNMLLRADSRGRVNAVRFAVLDECHYIGKVGRGTVWEEAILSCPPGIQLVALSATVANSQEIAGWLNEVHPLTSLVLHSERPVPLRSYYFRRGTLEPLAAENPLRDPRLRRAAATRPWEQPEDPAEVVAALAEADMLPAIYFAFSRRGCENALAACSPLDLLTPGEHESLTAKLDELAREYPSLEDYPLRAVLERGLATHHAGMLPAWRLAVERLFQQKLLKVVFATETLSAGINMPARTTVISSLRRPGEHGFRPLTPTEFLQMTGRAGRRGMDRYGNAVVLAEPQVAAETVRRLASAPPEPLGSVLSPGYSLVLNWLEQFGEAESRRRIEQGLAAYTRGGRPGEPPMAWRRFQAARAVLEHYGFLEGTHAVGLGLLTAAIQAENELLVALIVDASREAAPPRLAALCGALVGATERAAGRERHRTPGAEKTVRDLLALAVPIAADLRQVQHRCGFSCPTALSAESAGLAWLWSQGASWSEILDSTEMDEGDIVYNMRNTIDLLRQLETAPIRASLRATAASARQALDRGPVAEVL